ncbi:SMC-Scp complex subunit ScpB [Atopomonas sediminilitoris]|uniref:SMC-Scp complex subunit ScpB n=1 Tax=Atopomonas sediminilitoris TaxID=2919919 RepID=UPI001F4EF091|nr:SMC-Scp complex subunit ScpB [Atopomonas sediminilitoris]MCJ8169047.1 SMC-Scp complex subunit ScpB [Atopomonas sediminilitoris]
MDLNDTATLASLLEAFLLASGKPLSLERLADLFEEGERPDSKQIKAALAHLDKSCKKRAFELKEVASGYRLQIRDSYAPWVGRLWEEKPQRYSRAFLETLALIAYRQPITRGEIEDIRGVTVNSQIIKTLLERDWIRVVGHRDVPGKPAMLATTRAFLDYFNFSSLDQLPPLSVIRELELEPELPLQAPLSAKVVAPAVANADESHEEPADAAHKPADKDFRSLLAELDAMEQGLKSDFDDLREDEQADQDAGQSGHSSPDERDPSSE